MKLKLKMIQNKRDENHDLDILPELSVSPEYVIEDLIPNDEKCKLLFIFESPHKNEVDSKMILSGKSSLKMSLFLYLSLIRLQKQTLLSLKYQSILRQAISKLYNKKIIYFNEFIKEYCDVGLMNISRVPMQISAYKKDFAKFTPTLINKITELDKIRKSKEIDSTNEISNNLIQSTEARLSKYSPSVIVVCGGFAKQIISLTTLNTNPAPELFYIHHPSHIFDQVNDVISHSNILLNALKQYILIKD